MTLWSWSPMSWYAAQQVAVQMEQMRHAERQLLQWAHRFGVLAPHLESTTSIADSEIASPPPPSTTLSSFPHRMTALEGVSPHDSVLLYSSSRPFSSSSSSSSASVQPHAYHLRTVDTWIPRIVLSHVPGLDGSRPRETREEYVIHSVEVVPAEVETAEALAHQIENQEEDHDKSMMTTTTPPLVLLHGYANGAAYFYRNLIGLSRYFPTVYSLDWMGWGLSSRPPFPLATSSAATSSAKNESTIDQAEDFFVESLEAWRKARNLQKMVLVGHSIGGYLSVAYCERYPQHVQQLILLSPAGVTDVDPVVQQRWDARLSSTWRMRLLGKTIRYLFERQYTPGDLLRTLPKSTSQQWVQRYVQGRLPAIQNPDEQTAIADYLWWNTRLPPSGEYCLSTFLTVYAFGRRPVMHRIPHLQVPRVTFLYGSEDWMDIRGGFYVQEQVKKNQEQRSPGPESAKVVDVYQVQQAGHLLMLDNWREVNAGIIWAVHQHEQGSWPSGTSTSTPSPKDLPPSLQGLPLPHLVTAATWTPSTNKDFGPRRSDRSPDTPVEATSESESSFSSSSSKPTATPASLSFSSLRWSNDALRNADVLTS